MLDADLDALRPLHLTLNGRPLAAEVEPRTLLIDVMRRQGGLTGPRIGCEEGSCGACTVRLNGETVKSCLVLALEADGADIETAESLGTRETLSILQSAFKNCHAVQCGYCASGMLMSADTLLRKHAGKTLTDEMIRDGMVGNICRCTGYANIIRAIKVAAGQLPALAHDNSRVGDNYAGDNYIGRSMPRVEDNRLLTGGGRYVDAFNETGQLHMAVVPAQRAHARIKSIDTSRAAARRGVFAVVTGQDALKVTNPNAASIDMPGIRLPKQRPMAIDKVVFFGEPVALVLASSPEIAEDAVADVMVDYEDLPPAVDMQAAAALPEGDPGLLYPEWGTNLQTDYPFAIGDVDGVFAAAACVVEDSITSQRYAAQPLETRAVLAKYDAHEGTLVIRASTQVPHQARMWLSRVLSIPESKIQVIVGDVGGGFGAKLAFDAEYLPAIASRIYGVPVKWIEPRQNWIQSATQARDFVARTRAAFDASGRLLAVDTDVMGDVGCDGAERACGIGMPINGALYVTGAYKVDTMRFRARAVVTNKPPYGAYRGYGKDIANLCMERMMTLAAERLGIDPVEIRRINTVDQYPYQLASGPILENGSSQECLEKLAALMDLDKLRTMQADARHQGRYIGFGISTHITRQGVGVVGASGSWETFTPPLMHEQARLAKRGLFGRMRGSLRLAYQRARYPAFPNPHIRTNGFLIARDLLLSLQGMTPRRKADAWRFENFSHNMTRQIQARGLRPLIVGKDGVGYEIEDWPRSNTYRQGDQSNLLLTDNRTLDYDDATNEERCSFWIWAWQEQAIRPTPVDAARPAHPALRLQNYAALTSSQGAGTPMRVRDHRDVDRK